ncbi:MAG: M23 family metallopeptidase [Spirochaetia bacterium]|nr:M23 family metallopeptidase [Spirochaetia bacterium]
MAKGIGETITQAAAWLRKMFRIFMERGRHKWTIMIIPHTEHESRNIRVSNFVLYGFLGFLSAAVFAAALYMIDFTVRFKDLLRLQRAKDVESINTRLYKEELAIFQNRVKPYQGQAAALAARVPSTGLRFNGIGGRELSLEELSSSLKSYLETTGAKTDKPGLEAYSDFFRDSADMSEQLGLFIQKRKAFMTTLPTLWPVDTGLSQITRRPGDASTLRLNLAPGTPIRSGAEGVVLAVEKLGDKNRNGLLRVRIDHGFGFFTEYRGMLHTSVKEKDKIRKGEGIGQAGREFEYIVQIADTWVDPLFFAITH